MEWNMFTACVLLMLVPQQLFTNEIFALSTPMIKFQNKLRTLQVRGLMSHNQVIVLQAGYSYQDESNANAMRANCSCTLIRCRDGTNIIVDTLTAWDGEHLSSLLAAQGLQASDIDVVVCTHGHSDHIGCNYLFQQARLHLVGSCASRRDLYFEHIGALDTNGEVLLEKTPGHTLSCVSVIVHNSQLAGSTVGICGDLFERCDDIDNPQIWKDAGSEDEKQQAQQRQRMAQLCQYIVPGHGSIFKLDMDMCSKLERILESR